MRMLGILGVALAALSFSAPSTTGRADDANAECANNNDITVVVDFNELGGGVNVRCAPQPVDTGFDAFKRANIAVDDYRGFVCRIAGMPDDATCDRYPPANYYWVYWLAERGGTWCYSQVGAGNRRPPPGSAEGWSFFKKSSERPRSTPPRYPVPPPIAGSAPHRLDEGDCAGAQASSTTTTTTIASGRGAPPPPPGDPAPGGAPRAPGATGGRATTSSVVGASAGSPTTALELGLPATGAATTTTSAVPFGEVDLTIRRHESKSSPVGFLVGAGLVTAIAAVGYVMRRRSG